MNRIKIPILRAASIAAKCLGYESYAEVEPHRVEALIVIAENIRQGNQTLGHYYWPIECYNGAILKYQGEADQTNLAWMIDGPGKILVDQYYGDRIYALDYSAYRGGPITVKANIIRRVRDSAMIEAHDNLSIAYAKHRVLTHNTLFPEDPWILCEAGI